MSGDRTAAGPGARRSPPGEPIAARAGVLRRLARLYRRAAASGKLAVTLALAIAAASTGVVIPMLRPLVEQTGHGSTAAGVFTAAHVLGGVVSALFGTRALARAGSVRRLAAAALLASIAVTLAMAAATSLELRIALRFLDGACHLLAITALVAAATSGDPDQRAGRAVFMGVAIVLGIASGLGLGSALHRPEAALVMAALLSGGSLLIVLARVSDDQPAEAPAPAPVAHAAAPLPLAPGLLAFCERFSFGSMTVAMSFLATPQRIGLVLGVFMTASLLALGAARRCALSWGPRKLAVRSALGFTLALVWSAALDVLAAPGHALAWALVAGSAAGALYAAALVLATRSAEVEGRARGMAAVHAAGSAGHALGALSAGTLGFALPGFLVISVPGIAVIAAAAIGVWLTVPDVARDCPVLGALEPDEAPAPARSTRP